MSCGTLPAMGTPTDQQPAKGPQPDEPPLSKGWIAVGVAGVVGLVLLVGCGGADDDEPGSAPASAEPPAVELAISTPKDGASVRKPAVTIKGTATPGARVQIDEPSNLKDTAGPDGRWSIVVYPSVGTNKHRVRARVEGQKTASEPLSFVRNRTAAERDRLAREKAREESNFKARAVSIDYGSLEKSPGQHTGTDAVFTGQIAEIFEDSGRGIMRLQVTNQGYDIWTDDIWVEYEGTTSATREDVVTVYGTMTGVKTYETQIGGERSIPKMSAKYIDE